MGDLPKSRFEQGRAFLNVGVDLAGPFIIKESHRRKSPTSKAYLVLFVCLSSKALHTEIVSSLSTESFIAALERFIARRGSPKKIMSDNDTNFIGADRYLKDMYQWLQANHTQEALRNHLQGKEISWEFIPPASPHFGGIWEAGVKSIKTHLQRVVGMQILTLEELNTIAIRIEAILNSRPLCDVSSDGNEYEVLTPGHFLIGAPLTSLPEEELTDIPDNRLKRWYLLRKHIGTIWSRWRFEYLNTLQQRLKWTDRKANIQIDSLVVLRERNQPVMSWPVGRIIQTYPGADGAIRVVKIRTPSGEYIRPISKLAPLLPE